MRLSLILIFVMTISAAMYSTQQTDYLNYMYFNSHMNHLRTTHERGILLDNEEVFSVITDIRYSEYSGGSLMSVMYGAGYIDSSLTFGFYFLGFTSDIGFTFGNYNSEYNLYRDGFGASGIGISLFISPLALITFDWTFAFDSTYQYLRVFIPFIRSSFGFGFSPYENQVSIVSNTVVEKVVFTGGTPRFSILKFDSSILNYVGLGLEYITAMKTLSPILTFSVHNIIKPSDWDELMFDAFIYFRPSIEFNLQNVKLTKFEARVRLWFYFPDSGFGGMENNGGYLMSRSGLYCAFSYKQPDNGNPEVMGESGFGIEVGMGMAVLDNLNIGLKSDFFNISYFYNYSEYFDTFPIMSQGFRFLMYI